MGASTKPYWQDDAVIFAGFYQRIKKYGENSSFFRMLAWVLSWIFSTDHKRVGILYFVSMFSFFAVAVILGFLMRLELMKSGQQFFDPATYNAMFTLHGVIMTFLFIVPGIPAIFGNFFLPLQLGAEDVSMPRLNLASWYMYIIGAAMAVTSLFTNGGTPDGGWTFYAPYSILTKTNVTLALLAAFILGMSSIFTGMNFLTTIHRLKAKGMSWFTMPLFVWSLYATAWIQVLATPVVGITLLLSAMERAFGIGIFDPTKGGDPVLYQHMFWIYSHPVVYVMILPAMGVISEILPVFARRTIFGYTAIAMSTMAIAASGYFVWAHHMFTSGVSDVARLVFSFITFLVAIPTAIKIFNWLATLYKGSIQIDPPMLWALSFLFTFSIGGLTGLALGAVVTDIHLHDTYYVVGHFHYVMFGGGGVGMFAALHFWFPKVTGRMYNFTVAKIAWFFFFVGFNALYFPMLILGVMGMPRRYHDYLPQYELLNTVSTVGSWIMITGLVIMFFNLYRALRSGAKASANPWESKTLEWETQSPPILHNFAKAPEMKHGPYEYEGEWVQ